MPRALKWDGWLGLCPALSVLSMASFAISPPGKDNLSIAAQSSEIRIDSPRLFGKALVGMEIEPKTAPRTFGGFAGPAQVSLIEHAGSKTVGMPLPAQPGREGPRGACERSASDLCYDLADRRIVYRPVRQYMPKFDGLTAESISLRRNGVRLRYSFR